ncbi:hypothetical protein D3C81_1584640 [compost metagenome]
MPRRIYPIHRIAHAVHIHIQSTAAKRAPIVRAMKAHQSRVVGAVAVTQQVPANRCFTQLPIEAQPRRDCLLSGLFAIGGVADGVDGAVCDFGNDRVAAIRRQQHGSFERNVGLISDLVRHVVTFMKGPK